MYTLRFVLIMMLGAAGAAYATDWPHWRGPLATGVTPEAQLPVRWSDTENIVWKAPIRGLGVSSPIVSGDRVFVTSQAGSSRVRQGPRLFQGGDAAEAGELSLGASAAAAPDSGAGPLFVVTAFDRVSGAMLWEYELESEGELTEVHDKHNLASSSPVSDGERVYAWFGSGQIIALDMDGNLVWQRNLAVEYGTFDILWGHASSPVVYDGNLILLSYHPSATYLLGLDSRTGQNRWKVDGRAGGFSYSTPFIVETPAGAELVVNWSEGISGHDVSNGELLWHIEETNRFPIPVPTYHDGIIYTSRGYRSGPFMAIRPGGRGDVQNSHVLWKVETGAPYISSLVHYDGLIYMMGDVGVATVVDAQTGERIWQERVGGVFTASPVAGDGKVYFLSENGETIVLEAGRTPRVLSRNMLGARQLASPAVAGGRLFIRSDDALFAIGE